VRNQESFNSISPGLEKPGHQEIVMSAFKGEAIMPTYPQEKRGNVTAGYFATRPKMNFASLVTIYLLTIPVIAEAAEPAIPPESAAPAVTKVASGCGAGLLVGSTILPGIGSGVGLILGCLGGWIFS